MMFHLILNRELACFAAGSATRIRRIEGGQSRGLPGESELEARLGKQPRVLSLQRHHPQYIKANFDHYNADDTTPRIRRLPPPCGAAKKRVAGPGGDTDGVG
jgi:hypothetical protein